MGKPNVVYTGVVIKYGDHIAKFTEKTKVFFGQYSDEQIQAYVDTGEPLYVVSIDFLEYSWIFINEKICILIVIF